MVRASGKRARFLDARLALWAVEDRGREFSGMKSLGG